MPRCHTPLSVSPRQPNFALFLKTLDEARLQAKQVANQLLDLRQNLQTTQTALTEATNQLHQMTSDKHRLTAQLTGQEQLAVIERQQATATREQLAAECSAAVDACRALLSAVQGAAPGVNASQAPKEALQFVLAHAPSGCEEATELRKALQEQRDLTKKHVQALSQAEEQWLAQFAELKRQLGRHSQKALSIGKTYSL